MTTRELMLNKVNIFMHVVNGESPLDYRPHYGSKAKEEDTCCMTHYIILIVYPVMSLSFFFVIFHSGVLFLLFSYLPCSHTCYSIIHFYL